MPYPGPSSSAGGSPTSATAERRLTVRDDCAATPTRSSVSRRPSQTCRQREVFTGSAPGEDDRPMVAGVAQQASARYNRRYRRYQTTPRLTNLDRVFARAILAWQHVGVHAAQRLQLRRQLGAGVDISKKRRRRSMTRTSLHDKLKVVDGSARKCLTRREVKWEMKQVLRTAPGTATTTI